MATRSIDVPTVAVSPVRGEVRESSFLPELSPEKGPRPKDLAGWSVDGGVHTLEGYAEALVLPVAELEAERLKSVPSPWARLLLFEHALFNRGHPAHHRVVAEWRGLLGCIALDRYLGLKVEVVSTALPTEGSGVMADLLYMIPEAREREELWERIGLIRAGGALVGATSPRTLVFTGIRPIGSTSVPFGDRGRLEDPVEFYAHERDGDSLDVLTAWIRVTIEELRRARRTLDAYLGQQRSGFAADGGSRLSLLIGAFEGWGSDAEAALRALERGVPGPGDLDGSPFDKVFHDHPAQVFGVLQRAKAADSSAVCGLLVVGMEDTAAIPGAGGMILDPAGRPYVGRITIAPGLRLAVNVGRLSASEIASSPLLPKQLGDLSRLFEERLIRITDVNTAHARALEVGGQRYLIPFKPEILEALPPDRVAEWTRATGDETRGIEVSITVPVQDGLSVRWSRGYGRDSIESAFATPDLAVWPSFQASDWKWHYFYQFHTGERDRNIHFDPLAPAHRMGDDAEGIEWGDTDRQVRPGRPPPSPHLAGGGRAAPRAPAGRRLPRPWRAAGEVGGFDRFREHPHPCVPRLHRRQPAVAGAADSVETACTDAAGARR